MLLLLCYWSSYYLYHFLLQANDLTTAGEKLQLFKPSHCVRFHSRTWLYTRLQEGKMYRPCYLPHHPVLSRQLRAVDYYGVCHLALRWYPSSFWGYKYVDTETQEGVYTPGHTATQWCALKQASENLREQMMLACIRITNMLDDNMKKFCKIKVLKSRWH